MGGGSGGGGVGVLTEVGSMREYVWDLVMM